MRKREIFLRGGSVKFFEFAKCLKPAIPGGLPRASYMRELISMFTTITEEEWQSPRDPARLVSDSVLESMASRDDAMPKKLAEAICAKLDTDRFVCRMGELSLETQELIAEEIARFGEHIDLEDFAADVTSLLVKILRAKVGLPERASEVKRKIEISAAREKYKDLLLVRAQGCARCHTPLSTQSHAASCDSFSIIFLDSNDEIGPDDFAVTCKPCAEKYNLSHTSQDVTDLRKHNFALSASETIDAGLAPLGLDSKITQLLSAINQLPLDGNPPKASYDVLTLRCKLDDLALVRACCDAMATYETVVRNTCMSLEQSGDFHFDQMRNQIRAAWFVLRDNGLSQHEIYCRLIDWIDGRTHVDNYACRIVVAFMIQICDLFTPPEGVHA